MTTIKLTSARTGNEFIINIAHIVCISPGENDANKSIIRLSNGEPLIANIDTESVYKKIKIANQSPIRHFYTNYHK